MNRVVILGASRTPIGSFLGGLSKKSAPQLGSIAISGALKSAGIKPEAVDEVVMGNVLSAGTGQAPARQAMIYAGIPAKASAATVNKMCGSGLKAVIMASKSLLTGDSKVSVAGGMESMTRAPYLLEKARSGYKLGHGEFADSVLKDGLVDPYSDKHMGLCGEMCAQMYGFTRKDQDEYAVMSYTRAREAQTGGAFATEICPVDGVSEDEEPKKGDFAKMPALKPAFKKDGTITAANASKLNDGAAALVLSTEEHAEKLGAKPVATILGWAGHSQEPEWFTTAPAQAIEKLLERVGWTKDEVDLYEINEAFSVVSLVNMRLTGIPKEKVNVQGGAVALGHPIGASGARIVVTLINALKRRNLRKGVASICIGGGEALALAVELN